MNTPYTSSDLISNSALLAVADRLAGIYDRLKPTLGDSTESYSSTLNGSITITATSIVLNAPGAGSWQDVLPQVGTITIDTEQILYAGVATNTLTVMLRSVNGTTPAAHANNATVYLPASASAYAKRISQIIAGDGSTIYGVGESAAWVIRNLFATFDDETDTLTYSNGLGQLATTYFSALDAHISQVGSAVIPSTPAPSFGTVFINGLLNYLRYRNDRTSGSTYSVLMPFEVAYLYWLYTGGSLLNNKTVFPGITVFGTGSISGSNIFTFTLNGNQINRYGVPDGNTWTQGYVGQALQARVTTAGGGSIALTLKCQGMDIFNRYFGRPKSCAIALAAAITSGDSVTINGVVFTGILGSTNPSPNPSNQFATGPSQGAACDRLRDAINGCTDARIAGLITAVSDSTSLVTLTPTVPSNAQNYDVINPSLHISMNSGTQTGQSSCSFGGGAGTNPDEVGDGADSEASGAAASWDDLRTFTGTLDLTTAGNIIALTNGGGSDRVLRVISVSGSASGASTTSNIIIESVPDRTIH